MNENLIFGILFLKNITSVSAIQLFKFVRTFQWKLSEFFLNFLIFHQKVSKSTKTNEKDHSFYNTISLKKPHSFHKYIYIYMYIFSRDVCAFQKRSKILSGWEGGWDRG